MGYTTHKVHGKTFLIDTMDWSDEDSREKCEEELIDYLNILSEKEVETLHRYLKLDQEYGYRVSSYPECAILEDHEYTCSNIRRGVMEDWTTKPSIGYNAIVSAA